MAKVGAQRAAVLTGRSKSTIQRAMNGGKLSYELDANQRRVIDVSELERVFGIKSSSLKKDDVKADLMSDDEDFEMPESVSALVERAVEQETLRMRLKMLEDQLSTAHEQIDDLKDQRDKWEKQASQVLITSQYSQRQAEELKAQIKEREERARLRRIQIEQAAVRKQGILGNPEAEGRQRSGGFHGQSQSKEVRSLDQQMRSLKADNENTGNESGGSVFRFWKKAKG